MRRRHVRPSQIKPDRLVLRARPGHRTQGLLVLDGRAFPCAIGKGGIVGIKREGDGASPAGRWHMRGVYYRADHGQRPHTALPVTRIAHTDGWCDAPGDRNYNRRVRHPYAASAERLWREDHLYDLVVVLGYNDVPRARGRGSAIFMHLARAGYAPTEGCVALRRRDLERVLAAVGRSAAIVVKR